MLAAAWAYLPSLGASQSGGGSTGPPHTSWAHGWLVVLNGSFKGAICATPMTAVRESSARTQLGQRDQLCVETCQPRGLKGGMCRRHSTDRRHGCGKCGTTLLGNTGTLWVPQQRWAVSLRLRPISYLAADPLTPPVGQHPTETRLLPLQAR